MKDNKWMQTLDNKNWECHPQIHICDIYVATWQYYELWYRESIHYADTPAAIAYAGLLSAYRNTRYADKLLAKKSFAETLKAESFEDVLQERLTELVDKAIKVGSRSLVEMLMQLYGTGIFLKFYRPETTEEFFTALQTLKRELMATPIDNTLPTCEDAREILSDYNYYYLKPGDTQVPTDYDDWPFIRPVLFTLPEGINTNVLDYLKKLYPKYSYLVYGTGPGYIDDEE